MQLRPNMLRWKLLQSQVPAQPKPTEQAANQAAAQAATLAAAQASTLAAAQASTLAAAQAATLTAAQASTLAAAQASTKIGKHFPLFTYSQRRTRILPTLKDRNLRLPRQAAVEAPEAALVGVRAAALVEAPEAALVEAPEVLECFGDKIQFFSSKQIISNQKSTGIIYKFRFFARWSDVQMKVRCATPL
jgi:hypothetical protein